MPSPKPKPTHLRIVEGNPSGRKLNRDEPQPARTTTTPPKYLAPDAKAIWRRLAPQLKKLHLFTSVDRDMLGAYCTALARAKEADAAITEHGMTYETVNQQGETVVKRRPETAIIVEQLRLAKALAAEFGLTPSSRTRFDGLDSEAKDDAAFLFGKG